MTGTKRSGGKATTPKAKAAKAAAAAARWRGAPTKPAKAKAAGPASSAMNTLSDHDAQLGLPVTWGDSLKRKQVVEQDLINDRRRVELEESKMKLNTARQRLVERSELDKTAAIIRDTWATSARHIASDTLAALAAFPVESRELVKVAVEATTDKAAERVAEQLKASK
jgi:hypothetical protein